MRGAEWEPGEGGTETILLMAQMLGFSRFSRVLQVLQNFQNFQTSQEYRIPVPSPRNRANHGPSMPCHGPLPMTVGINKRQLITVSSRILDALEDGKTNQTSPGRHPMLTNAVAFGTSQTHPRRTKTHPRCSRCDATDPTSDCRGPANGQIGECGAAGSGRVPSRSGAGPVRVGGLGGACPGRDAVAVVTGGGPRLRFGRADGQFRASDISLENEQVQDKNTQYSMRCPRSRSE